MRDSECGGRSRESRAWIYAVPGISAADAEGGSSQPVREPSGHPRVYIATSLADLTSLGRRALASRVGLAGGACAAVSRKVLPSNFHVFVLLRRRRRVTAATTTSRCGST